jgi:lysozyme
VATAEQITAAIIKAKGHLASYQLKALEFPNDPDYPRLAKQEEVRIARLEALPAEPEKLPTPTAETAASVPQQSIQAEPQPIPSGTLTAEEKDRLDNTASPPTYITDDLPLPGGTTNTDDNSKEVTAEPPVPVNASSGPEVTTDTSIDPAKSTGSTSDKPKFEPIMNPLHGYATYTYNLSLHILPKDAFNKLQDTGEYKADGNRVLVAGAGRVDATTFSRNKHWEADFYFDAFKMTSVIGHNSKNKGTNSLEMSFTIIEPYGISFLDRLINTCGDLGIKNYMSVPYIIQLDFFGYSDKAIQGNEPYNPVRVPEGTRIFPIRLLSMSIAFDQKGTTYNFTAVPYNHSALSELNITLPTTTTIRAGGTRLLTDFFSMNEAEVDSLSSARGGATKERRDKAIADMVDARQKEIDKYNKDLPELQKKYEAELSRQAAAPGQNTSGSGTVPVATKPMQPPPTPLTTETATVEYDKRNSNSIAKPTGTHATGLATVLNDYNRFLQKEYNLVGPPIIYKFSFLPPIDKATIGDPGRLPGDTAPMETKKPVEQNAETLRPGAQPPAATSTAPIISGSADIKQMIKDHEGVRNVPYQDSLGLWTVGVGHLIGDGKVKPEMRTYSAAEIDAMFTQDFNSHAKAAESIPGFKLCNAQGQGALIDLTFNMGNSWYKGWPGFCSKLSAGNFSGAAAELKNSQWYGQVGNRAPKIVSMIAGAGGGGPNTGGSAFSDVNSGSSSTAAADCPPTNPQTPAAEQPVGIATSQQFAALTGTDVVFREGTSILTVINQMMKSSSYITEQLKIEVDTAMANNTDKAQDPVKAKEQLTKAGDPLNHFRVTPIITMGDFDPQRNDHCREITFVISPYKMHGVDYPGIKKGTVPQDVDCVKEYNYLFTGQNVDVTDLKINFDSSFYTAVSARPARLQDVNNSAAVGAGAPQPVNTGEGEQVSKFNKVIPTSLVFSPAMPGGNKLTQAQTDAMRANDLMANIYSGSVDTLSMSMEIVGDPGYLQQEEFTVNPSTASRKISTDNPNARTYKDGSLIMSDKNLLIKVNFKFPTDIDTETGLIKFPSNGDSARRTGNASTMNAFTGIYKILTIENTLSGGLFKQKLEMIRLYSDTDANKANVEKASALTAADQEDADMGAAMTANAALETTTATLTTTTTTTATLTTTPTTSRLSTAGSTFVENKGGAATGITKVDEFGRSQATQLQDRNAVIRDKNAVIAAEKSRIAMSNINPDTGERLGSYTGPVPVPGALSLAEQREAARAAKRAAMKN